MEKIQSSDRASLVTLFSCQCVAITKQTHTPSKGFTSTNKYCVKIRYGLTLKPFWNIDFDISSFVIHYSFILCEDVNPRQADFSVWDFITVNKVRIALQKAPTGQQTIKK